MEMENAQQKINPEGNLNQDTPLSNPILNQKGNFLLIIGIIVLLLVIGAGGYFLYQKQVNKPVATQVSYPTPSPTSDETANWKTYTNTQYGYSIKYPPTIAFKSDRFYLVGDDNRKDTADGFGPNLAIYFRGSDKTPQEIASQELPGSTQTLINVSNATGVKISGLEIDYYLVSANDGKNVLRIMFSSQDYSQTVPKDKIDQMKSIANQMLSTFKFTDQATDSTNTYNANDVNNFPPYPGSVFINKEKHEPCPSGGAGGFAICDTVTYVWETKDDYDQVSLWYREDKSNSGWKCSGGAGSYVSSRDARGRTTCRKGNLAYSLDLSATATKTQITLVIPK